MLLLRFFVTESSRNHQGNYVAFTCSVPEGSLVLQRNWKRFYKERNWFHRSSSLYQSCFSCGFKGPCHENTCKVKLELCICCVCKLLPIPCTCLKCRSPYNIYLCAKTKKCPRKDLINDESSYHQPYDSAARATGLCGSSQVRCSVSVLSALWTWIYLGLCQGTRGIQLFSLSCVDIHQGIIQN